MIARLLLATAALGLGACVIEYTVPADTTTTGETMASVDATADGDGCIAGRELCGDACIDLSSDPEHCGSCDGVCAGGDVCDAAECVATCRDGRVDCNRACVESSSDPFHCGECDEVCDLDGECVGGDCKDACGDTCDRTLEVCVSAQCVCRPGFTSCDGTCVDLGTDPDHCGSCDRACDGDPCGGGECQPGGCDDFPDQCGDSCTDLSTDPLHCRECDRTCDGDEVCVDGDCDNVD